MTPLDWTSLNPDRFAYEVNEMEALGFHLDEQERQSTGRVVFRGTIAWAGDDVELELVYPAAFPYFRPEVHAPGLHLARHQNPFEHNLCLLDRSSRAWNTTDTGAWLVTERVPYLLELLEDDERMAVEEVPQGEPMSTYFGSEPGSAVFIPEAMLALPKDVPGGTAYIAVGQDEQLGLRLRGCLSRVCTKGAKKKERQLAAIQGALVRRFPSRALALRWVRLAELPEDTRAPQRLLQAARAAPGFQEPAWTRHAENGEMQVVGIVVEEEVRQGEQGDTWLFAVRVRDAAGGNEQVYTTQGQRFGETDLTERVPALTGMAGKTVALVGLGALGGPLSMELARAQLGELRILDFDTVDAGTIVRWPFGVNAVGHKKTTVIGGLSGQDYPYTKVRQYDHRIGAAAPPGPQPPKTEMELLDEFLDGVDLLIDASAELGVQQFVASLADARGIPQAYVWATEGGWGGAVARVLPGMTGCWYCLQMQLDETPGIPVPPHDNTGRVQPRGCDNPTFTATSFDALPIVAQAMRVITGTLLHGRVAGADDDVFICSQEPAPSGAIIAPSWSSHALTVQGGCPLCKAHP